MVNVHGKGRCAITLDPRNRQEGQQPYQGVVPLVGEGGAPLMDLAAVVEHYMRHRAARHHAGAGRRRAGGRRAC
jgi:molecular chaperone Hsp33